MRYVCYMCGFSLGWRRREDENPNVKFASAKHQNPSKKTLKAVFFKKSISGVDFREHSVRDYRKYKPSLADL